MSLRGKKEINEGAVTAAISFDAHQPTVTTVTATVAVSESSTYASPGSRPVLSPRSESVEERVDRWFIQPLRKMGEDEGFIILMVLLPLYEKHLRIKHGMGEKESFSKGHRAVKTIASHLGVTDDEAYEFWQHVRNGLLHRALLKEDAAKFVYVIQQSGPPLNVNRGIYWINPRGMRERLLQEIEPDLKMWEEDCVTLPTVFDR